MTSRYLFVALAFVGVLACSKKPVPDGIASGVAAPQTTLTSTKNQTVALADTFRANSQTIVVFYRGFH